MQKVRTTRFFVFTPALIAVGLLSQAPAWSQEFTPILLTKVGVTQQQAAMESKSLIGRNVQDAEHETIGTIKKLVFDTKGKVSHVVLATGGFLGLGEKLVKVPYDRLQITANEILLSVSEEEFKTMEPYEEAKS
ncbi:MAG: PRC-barrel domain-containing protein [Pseudomonadota bacterium]